MKDFVFTVIYNATVTEKTLVNANTKEEAIEKIKNGYVDDIVDSTIETHDIIDIIEQVIK